MMNASGPTNEMSLRVSVASLARVLFKDPRDGELMIALERRATRRETQSGHVVNIQSQPFGGAMRIRNLNSVRDLIGNLQFDSEHSLAQQDFRLFIRPSSWPALREFCHQHITLDHDPILENDPRRELAEEFADALRVNLGPEQYTVTPLATFDENEAAPTENIYAKGYPTVRIYRVFEASIEDTSLARLMLEKSQSISDQSLSGFALEDAQNGGKGRASAILALSWRHLHKAYEALPEHERNAPVLFRGEMLDSTVTLILDGVAAPRYKRL